MAGIASVAIGMKLAQGMPKVYLPSRLHHADEVGLVSWDGYQYETYSVGTEGAGERYGAALARSMMQTKEQVAANVLNRAFADYTPSGEGARRAVGERQPLPCFND